MATDKQRQANRHNAQKSTGPTSEAGRARSSYNALKHGLCARHFDFPDDPPRTISIQETLDHWNDFYQPSSPMQAFLIRQIVSDQYRLDRTPRFETGLLAKTTDEQCYNTVRKDEKTGKLTRPLTYDADEDRDDADIKSTRLLGMAWRDMSREGDPLPKLQRYETAIANRLHKNMKLLLEIRGGDARGELRNEPNLDLSPVESTPVEEPAPPPPAPEPVPEAPVAAEPAPESAPEPAAKTEPANGTPVPPPAAPRRPPVSDLGRPDEPLAPAESGPVPGR